MSATPGSQLRLRFADSTHPNTIEVIILHLQLLIIGVVRDQIKAMPYGLAALAGHQPQQLVAGEEDIRLAGVGVGVGLDDLACL
jgi:hypothetical protein